MKWKQQNGKELKEYSNEWFQRATHTYWRTFILVLNWNLRNSHCLKILFRTDCLISFPSSIRLNNNTQIKRIFLEIATTESDCKSIEHQKHKICALFLHNSDIKVPKELWLNYSNERIALLLLIVTGNSISAIQTIHSARAKSISQTVKVITCNIFFFFSLKKRFSCCNNLCCSNGWYTTFDAKSYFSKFYKRN